MSILEAAPYLMPAQLDEVAGKLLKKRLEKLGLSVHTQVELLEVLVNDGVRFVQMRQGLQEAFLEVELLIVSCGIRPRDELARECGLELGEKGGVKVEPRLFTWVSTCSRAVKRALFAYGGFF